MTGLMQEYQVYACLNLNGGMYLCADYPVYACRRLKACIFAQVAVDFIGVISMMVGIGLHD